MAITKNTIAVEFSSASSVSIAAGGTATSDEFDFDANCIGEADYQLKANNDGTPASGDTVTVRLALSADGTNFPGINACPPLAVIDTNLADPDSKTIRAPASVKGKLIFKNNSAGRAITVSAAIVEYLLA